MDVSASLCVSLSPLSGVGSRDQTHTLTHMRLMPASEWQPPLFFLNHPFYFMAIIHPLKYFYTSVVFRLFTGLCSHCHYLILEHFSFFFLEDSCIFLISFSFSLKNFFIMSYSADGKKSLLLSDYEFCFDS